EVDPFFVTNLFGIVDLQHVNGVETDVDGNILLLSRNFNEITKIDRKDGSVIWRLGGNLNQFKFVNWPVPFYGAHDLRRLKNGHFTLFDNGRHMESHGARALEFELDQVKKIATLKWSYTYDPSMFSKAHGNVQRLEN